MAGAEHSPSVGHRAPVTGSDAPLDEVSDMPVEQAASETLGFGASDLFRISSLGFRISQRGQGK
jgi:hypothetical protein